MVTKKTLKKIALVFVIIIILASIILFIRERYGRHPEDVGVGYTLKEAYTIAFEKASEWSESAYLIKVNSTDLHDTESIENGIDGKRNCWNFLFESEEKMKQYAMYIINGEPFSVEEVQSPGYQPIDIENIMDSSQLYQIALKQGMKGGVDWAFGYHYILQYTYLNANSDTPILTYTVRGLDEQDREFSIMGNPYDGQILLMLVKTGYDEDGRSIWTSTYDAVNSETDEAKQDEVENLSREEVQKQYDVFHSAKEHLVDPEALTDAIMDGLQSDRFDPYSKLQVFTKEEWERQMTEQYGEEWKGW